MTELIDVTVTKSEGTYKAIFRDDLGVRQLVTVPKEFHSDVEAFFKLFNDHLFRIPHKPKFEKDGYPEETKPKKRTRRRV